jgi:hypothetical protein
VTTELKYFHEFDVENRAQGDAGHGILAAVLGPLRVSCLLMALLRPTGARFRSSGVRGEARCSGCSGFPSLPPSRRGAAAGGASVLK